MDSAVATVSIQIVAVNDPPEALNDSYTATEDTVLVIDAANGVIANDSDADGDPLDAIKLTDPAKGTVELNDDGSFTYTPDANATGTDTFTYRASDGSADSNVATVTIDITPVNDAPIATDDSYSTAEDTPLTIAAAGLLLNDSDPDGDPLTAIQVSQPSQGTITVDANGGFTYTPNANATGADSFTYQVNDGDLDSAVATVSIQIDAVNDPPEALNDLYTTTEDTPLVIATAVGVLANDSDVDGDPLDAIKLTDPSKGTVTLNVDGSFTYTPDANATGTDTFTYKANDGSVDSNVATATIDITPVNDLPVAVDDSYTTTEDTPLTIAADAGLLLNDSDPDGDPLAAIQVSQPNQGTVSVNADGSFTYTPNADATGQDSFTYVANDSAADSVVATVTIQINPVNDPPSASDDSYTTTEDTPLVVDVQAGVLDNDFDIDGDPLTAILASEPAQGSVTLNSDGSFTYTPNADANGTDSFTYRASDGSADSNLATVTIQVTPTNDAPVALGDNYNVDEDGSLVVAAQGVLQNDSDADFDPLTAAKLSDPAKGTVVFNSDGSFTYTPDVNATGLDSFTYVANDGTADSNVGTVTIDILPLNDPPEAQDDSFTVNEDAVLSVDSATGALANDTDVDQDSLDAIQLTDPSKGSVVFSSDGSFTYTPDANATGTDTFT